MDHIRTFFAELPISERLRAQLLPAEPSARHHFYLQLPTIFAGAFPGVSGDQLRELTLSSYLYFRFVLYLDDLLDGDASLTGPGTAELLLTQVKLHEYAIRGLANLFPRDHAFWGHFTRCQQVFAQAQHQERAAARATGGWTQKSFERLAVAKSAVGEALLFALHGLSPESGNLAAALDCLRQYHLASQYEDDVLDFQQDCERDQHTYVHGQVVAYVREHAPGVCAPYPPQTLRRYLYTSGIAERHLEAAELAYAHVEAQAIILGLDGLASAAAQQGALTARHRSLAAEHVASTRAAVQAQLAAQLVEAQ